MSLTNHISTVHAIGFQTENLNNTKNEFKKTKKSCENTRRRNTSVVCENTIQIFEDQNSPESSKETENIKQTEKSIKTLLENSKKVLIENIKDNINPEQICTQGNNIHKLRKDNIQENFKILYNEMNKSAKSKKVLSTRSVLCSSILDASFSNEQKRTLCQFNNLLIEENRKMSNLEKAGRQKLPQVPFS